VLLQVYWQVKCCTIRLKQCKLSQPLCTLTPLVIFWEEEMGVVLVQFHNQLIVLVQFRNQLIIMIATYILDVLEAFLHATVVWCLQQGR